MKFSKTGFGKIGLALAAALIPGIGEIEAVARALPKLRGKDKQISDLIDANRRLSDALEEANATMEKLIDAGNRHAAAG